MKEYTDKEIIECLRDRQSYVVSYLHDRYLPMIRMMVTQLGGTSDDAMDIFQDGLMILIEKLDKKEFSLTCKFKTFLYCVCENLWKSVLEKKQAAANYFVRKVDEEEKDFTEVLDNKLYKSIFHDAFETLDQAGKNILNLYWEEMSPQEIADKLGFTYGYVRKKKCEAQSELIMKVKTHPDYIKIMRSERLENHGNKTSSQILEIK